MDRLKDNFSFPHVVPSHDTYQRLWDSLSPFVSSLEKVSSDVMSLDGKTIRHSGKEKALPLVSAWCHQNQMVFGQERSNAKGDNVIALKRQSRNAAGRSKES